MDLHPCPIALRMMHRMTVLDEQAHIRRTPAHIKEPKRRNREIERFSG